MKGERQGFKRQGYIRVRVRGRVRVGGRCRVRVRFGVRVRLRGWVR